MKKLALKHFLIAVLFFQLFFVIQICIAGEVNQCTGSTTVWCIDNDAGTKNCGYASCSGVGENGRCGLSTAGCEVGGALIVCHKCNSEFN